LKNSIIKYYSTNRKAPEVTFREALLEGLAPDGGLYLPDSIPVFSKKELWSFSGKEYHEIAFEVLNRIIGNEINKDDLIKLCLDSYDFAVPLEKVYSRNYIMRLDEGPTASFKDFAARMMSRLMQHFLALNDQHLVILTATSGDTGSAVANAFCGMPNIDVVILFPKDEVTVMQRKQMTTLQNNISVIAIDGKFDDCQKLAKTAFMDQSLSLIPLSSANSINIGRLIPQSVYYFYAWSKLVATVDDKVVFSVPSGNFGNLMGGVIARQMGLPVAQFIISTNDNNEVPELLRTGRYSKIDPSKNCISSAMNVGHPSNLARIIAIYGGIMDENGIIIKEPDIERMRNDFFPVSVTDEETRTTISDIYRKHKIIMEPHGAVAWFGIREYLKKERYLKPESQLYIALETAHPAKFPEELQKVLNINPALPCSLESISEKSEKYHTFENSYGLLKDFILKNYLH